MLAIGLRKFSVYESSVHESETRRLGPGRRDRRRVGSNVSVIYLGRQINDNTKLLRSQAHYNALSLAQKPLEMMVENESLAGAGNGMRRQSERSRRHDLGALRQLLLHAVQFLGIHVLSEPRRFYPAAALGRGRRLLQDARTNEARLRALLD